MNRYFLEVAYKGAAFSGFQKQPGAKTVQSELEKALQTVHRQTIDLTGSSRTDAGVHALQNFFHFDAEAIPDLQRLRYQLNAILPKDISVSSLRQMNVDAHCRFDAVSRSYEYHLYHQKNPFLSDRAYFFPYTLDLQRLNEAANLLFSHTDYTSFSKRNTQVKTFLCTIGEAMWKYVDDELIFYVTANRFLRGMVRGLTGTMLKVGRGQLSTEEFEAIIEAKDCRRADFSVPAHGLFLTHVRYPDTTAKSKAESN